MIILAFIGPLRLMELCTDQLLRAQLVPFETKRVLLQYSYYTQEQF